WVIPRLRADLAALRQAATWIRAAKKPFIIAGGGVIYSEASVTLDRFAASTGIPVGETQAGKGSLPFTHKQSVGGVGVTGTAAANILAREADLVIGIGTRYSDFTSASKTAFQNPKVRFINIDVSEFDAFKQAALPLQGDAKVTLEELAAALAGFRVAAEYEQRIRTLLAQWDTELKRIYSVRADKMT